MDQDACFPKLSDVLGIEHGTAADRDHDPVPAGRVGHRVALEAAKYRLAVFREDRRDELPGPVLDEMVGVDERAAEPLRQTPSHLALARSHEAHQHDCPSPHQNCAICCRYPS